MADDFTSANGADGFATLTIWLKEATTIEPQDLLAAGEWLAKKRAEETRSGRDVDGGLFAPYSPNYAFRKGSSTVDLYSAQRHEHMLDALQAQVEGDVLQVGIFNDDELATRARVTNEGAEVRTQLGMGREGFKNHPGRRQVNARGKKGKGSAVIPPREWLGASQADLDHMAELIIESVNKRLQNLKG